MGCRATIGRPIETHEREQSLMEYVNLDAQVGDLSNVLDPTRYLEHLPSIAGDLPPAPEPSPLIRATTTSAASDA